MAMAEANRNGVGPVLTPPHQSTISWNDKGEGRKSPIHQHTPSASPPLHPINHSSLIRPVCSGVGDNLNILSACPESCQADGLCVASDSPCVQGVVVDSRSQTFSRAPPCGNMNSAIPAWRKIAGAASCVELLRPVRGHYVAVLKNCRIHSTSTVILWPGVGRHLLHP